MPKFEKILSIVAELDGISSNNWLVCQVVYM